MRRWLFTPRGALAYFAIGYALIAILALAGCAAPGSCLSLSATTDKPCRP